VLDQSKTGYTIITHDHHVTFNANLNNLFNNIGKQNNFCLQPTEPKPSKQQPQSMKALQIN
jgi:hypothetical protein